MVKPILKGVRVNEIDFVNKLANGEKIELEHRYSYSVRYAPDNHCLGEFKANVSNKNNPEKFHLNVTMAGQFAFDKDATKEQLHLDTYDALFPYVRAYISNITAVGGIPPIIAPYIDISNQTIYRVDIPKKNEIIIDESELDD